MVSWVGDPSLAVAYAADYFDSGAFLADLARRVAFPTESGVARCRPDMLAYLEEEMVPAAGRLGATARVLDNPDADGGPFLIAHRHEAGDLPTVLTYGHADVVLAEAHRWRAGLGPWRLSRIAGMAGERLTTRASTPSTWPR